ncbi:hypothetical protein CPB83DRAFT_775141, partial [Crepidotus variabilis]
MPFDHYLLSFVVLRFFFCHVQAAEWASSTMATIPLALRSPYLNVWTDTMTSDGHAQKSTGDIWPALWNGRVSLSEFFVTGWAGLVRVDGKAYSWQGQEGVSTTTQTVPSSIRMSPTRTTFKTIAGPVRLTITYLSPIEV